MKSKGKIKLFEKERNKVDLICGTPCHSTTCEVFGKTYKRNQSQTIYIFHIYIHYSYTIYKDITSLGWKDPVPVENQYYQL